MGGALSLLHILCQTLIVIVRWVNSITLVAMDLFGKLASLRFHGVIGGVRPTSPVVDPSEQQHCLESIRDHVEEKEIKSHFGNRFVPEDSISELIKKVKLESLFPDKGLAEFVRSKARKVFLITVVSMDSNNSELVQIMKIFREKGLSDEMLPIPELHKNGECIHRTIAKTEYHSRSNQDRCRHPSCLSAFHQKPWTRQKFGYFYGHQWLFTAPVFSTSNCSKYTKELPENTVLPVTWRNPTPRSGHFSDVYEAEIHADHLVGFGYIPVCFKLNEALFISPK